MVVGEQLRHLLWTSRSSNHCPRSRSFFNLSPSSINCNMDEWSLRPLGCLPVTKTSQDDQHEVSSRARMRMYEDRRGWVMCMVFNLRFKEWKLTYTMKAIHSTENLYYHDFFDPIHIYNPNPISSYVVCFNWLRQNIFWKSHGNEICRACHASIDSHCHSTFDIAGKILHGLKQI